MDTKSVSTRTLMAVVLVAGTALAANDCGYDLRPIWSAALRDSPLTATPLLFDVDGDGYDDIMVPSFSGEMWSVHGESGHIVDGWPFYLEDRGFHASPLTYDVNRDGVLDFLLATTEAELVFVGIDGALMHGETIKVPPLRLQRRWFALGETELGKMTDILIQQLSSDQHFRVDRKVPKTFIPPTVSTEEATTPFSEFDSRYGRYSDPLYSRHQPDRSPSGLDPKDHDYVYVDAHVLATPTLADLDGDGLWNELVVPVSYYFDPFTYGMSHNLERLGGLPKEELVNFAAGGVVVVDLTSGEVWRQSVLGVTRASSDQPGYLLSSPTVVTLNPNRAGAGLVVVIGSAAGELHALSPGDLSPLPGFPLFVDSVSSQVAVADLFGTGELHMVVGDDSGNVYCVSGAGQRVWEYEAGSSISSPTHFADFDGDGKLEVVVVTKRGSLVVLAGRTGDPFRDFPMHLELPAMGGAAVIRLNRSSGESPLSLLLPSINTLFAVEPLSGCLHSLELEHVVTGLQAADVDPFSPGLELLATTLGGELLCLATGSGPAGVGVLAMEAWPGDGAGGNLFEHKSSSFAVVLPHSNHTLREITGASFRLRFQLVDGSLPEQRPHRYTVSVSVGRKHLLYSDAIHVDQRVTDVSLSVPTPPSPIHAFLSLRVCNGHVQCQSATYIARFNLHFEDQLKWFLCLPFLSLAAALMWLLREEGFQALPTTHRRRKDL